MAKKVLVIRFSPIKLFVQSMAAMSAIRNKHKNDEVYLLTEETFKSIAKPSGFFDHIIIDKKPEWYDFLGVYNIMKELKNHGFDQVYDLQNDSRSEWYFRLIGYKKPQWNSSAINWCSQAYLPPENEILHFHNFIHNQLKIAGVPAMPDIDISYIGVDKKPEELPEKYAVICAGGNKYKQAHKWPPEQYAEIIEYLEKYFNIKSILVGDEDFDYWLNKYIIDNAPNASPINIAGKTSLKDLITLAKFAEFCLGNETAPAHIAAYTGTNTVMLCSRFSPSEYIAPLVNNLAVIEEPNLEDVTLERVSKTIEEFALIHDEKEDKKEYKLMAETSEQEKSKTNQQNQKDKDKDKDNLTEKNSTQLQQKPQETDEDVKPDKEMIEQKEKQVEESEESLISKLPENLRNKITGNK